MEVEEGKFKGFVSPIVVDEVFYKSIVAEVMTKKNIPLKDISSYIKSNPSVLKTLKNPYELLRTSYLKKI